MDKEKGNTTQYNVYERKLIDKSSYFEWKLSYIFEEEDLKEIKARREAQ